MDDKMLVYRGDCWLPELGMTEVASVRNHRKTGYNCAPLPGRGAAGVASARVRRHVDNRGRAARSSRSDSVDSPRANPAGGLKLRATLQQRAPAQWRPAPSTIGELLAACSLSPPAPAVGESARPGPIRLRTAGHAN